jgi:hypothetical protein
VNSSVESTAERLVSSYEASSTPPLPPPLCTDSLTPLSDFHASNTTHLRGMLGKVPRQVCKVVQHPVWNAIMHEILKTRIETYVGDHLLVTETSHQMSLAVGFQVGPGANDQVLHRDQSIHSVDAKEGSLYTTDVGCLVAGTDSTIENGATRVVPGSHVWPPTRIPRVEEAVYATMKAG